jgi:hypothetical protein
MVTLTLFFIFCKYKVVTKATRKRRKNPSPVVVPVF